MNEQTMGEKAEQLLRELRKYQKSAAAYEKARLKMIKTEHRALGLTDAVVRRELKSIGVDVKSLLKDTAAEEKQLPRTHKKLLALVRPPILPGDLVLEIPPDPNVFDVKPPAIQGFGGGSFSDADCGFNLALGETNLFVSEQGDGWGWQATAGQPGISTLVFLFTPPRAGNILVDAYVDFKGQFAISAHDHWYTNTSADITLSVSSRLYQHYWEFGPGETIIDEHRTSSSNSAWVDRLVRLGYSTSVSANDTVLIFVEVVLDTNAHSSHAKVDVDFKTGAERRIKVPLVQIRYF
jgi:hypothetical protein